MSNAVKHPSHYAEGRKFEPKDVIRDWKLNFNLGNAVKYIARAGRKEDIVQDLKKAQEYIQFEIEAIEAEREKELNDDKLDAMRYGLGVLRDLPTGSSVDWSKENTLEITVPAGTPPEQVVRSVLDNLWDNIFREE